MSSFRFLMILDNSVLVSDAISCDNILLQIYRGHRQALLSSGR
jgi:hypothetical protein